MVTSPETSLRPHTPRRSTTAALSVPETPKINGLANFEPLPDLESVGISRFRAVEVATAKNVLVRILDTNADAALASGFNRHAQVATHLAGHAATVPILGASTDSYGRKYVVSPYYARGSLAGFLADHGPVSWRHSTFLMEQVAVTVAELHGSRIVHRNLQPSVIALTDFLSPRLDRFDHCLRIGDQPGLSPKLEPTGFHPPEISRDTPIDPRVDVYSLGALLWALLAGHPPPRINDGDPQLVVASPNPQSPTPTQIMGLVDRCLAVDPERRPANGAAFVTELRRRVGAIQSMPIDDTHPRSVMSSLTKTRQTAEPPPQVLEQDTIQISSPGTVSKQGESKDSNGSQVLDLTTIELGLHKLDAEPLSDGSQTDQANSVLEAMPSGLPDQELSPAVAQRSADADARWLLVLVGVITVVVVVMVSAAIASVS